MGIFSSLFHSRDKPADGYRPQNKIGSGFSFLFGGTSSGKTVNERTAMQTTAVYSCVRILAESLAGLPIHLYRYNGNGGKEKVVSHPLYALLHDEPNPEMTSFVFRETLMSHLLLWGNAYAQIIRDGRGRALALYPLLPNKMEVNRAANGEIFYTYRRDSDERDNKGFVPVTLRNDEILHIPGLGFDGLVGYSPVAMTGVQGSVGGENWCVYADLNAYCDTASIMSYGMAWAGSAPGPVSPRSWLEGIYDYATRVMSPDKVFLGLPAYGWNWQIHSTPQSLGNTYRGVSNTYYAAKNWMTGVYNFTDDKPPQPFIPIIAYWDDHDKVPWALPQVYDYMEGWDATAKLSPITQETYNRRRYLTCYGKSQRTSFGTIYADRNGIPDSYTGNVIIGESDYPIRS